MGSLCDPEHIPEAPCAQVPGCEVRVVPGRALGSPAILQPWAVCRNKATLPPHLPVSVLVSVPVSVLIYVPVSGPVCVCPEREEVGRGKLTRREHRGSRIAKVVGTLFLPAWFQAVKCSHWCLPPRADQLHISSLCRWRWL